MKEIVEAAKDFIPKDRISIRWGFIATFVLLDWKGFYIPGYTLGRSHGPCSELA